MSQFNRVVKELKELSSKIPTMVKYDSWDMMDEILKIAQIFGERINSNGIRTQKDVQELQEIKSKDQLLFAELLYENLQLLIFEYEKIENSKSGNDFVIPFEYNNYSMALIKYDEENFYFINEIDEEIESLFSSLDVDTEAIILIGYGSGLLQSKLSNNYHTLTIDPFSLSLNIENDFIMSFSNQSEKNLLQQKLQSFIGLKTEVIAHPLYPHSHKLVELLKSVRHLLEEVQIDLNTRVLYTENWYKEMFKNASHIKKQAQRVLNIDQLRGRYKGSDVLMVAGGPSLEESIPFIKQAQHAYYIIAIGQTAKVLLKHNIYPDFVISIDVSEANAYFFKDIELDVPLVYSLQVNNHIPQKSKGLLIPYVDNPLAKNLLYASKETFNSYPTVALAAVAFSNYLGFDKIGLIGQDLALRDGEYYSPSVKKVSSNEGILYEKLYDVQLNNGQKGKTTPVLHNFLMGYASLIKQYPELELKLVNYSEKGAVIENVPYNSLKMLKNTRINKLNLTLDVNDSEVPVNIKNVKDKIENIINASEFLKKRLNRIVKNKAVTVQEFEKILRTWDSLIEIPYFRTYALPLQFLNFLIIQNKIHSHNRYKNHSSIRLQVLIQMFETIESLVQQSKSIQEINIEV